MRPSFYPRTVNGPFDDPGIFIPFMFENRAVLFDLGDIHSLSPKDILKIDYAFVSHTHMDHFTGFDRLLRLLLGREKSLYIYGPEGFLKNVEGKLSGYTWNLVETYENRFTIYATEIHPDRMIMRQYECRNRFIPQNEIQNDFTGTLVSEPSFSVTATILDHGIPCLGFCLTEQYHINIIKDKLNELGLDTGPWLRDFKQALFCVKDLNTIFDISIENEKKQFQLGYLKDKIARITPGQKIAYITDVGYNSDNSKKIIEFVQNADYLFIESSFLEEDRNIAASKHHLTAFQAGNIARKAGVKHFTIFHFSPRYTGKAYLLIEEAEKAFKPHSL